MISKPLVSVIVPAYNCATLIPETLASLFDQGYPNIEIIVVNDGSKDNTVDVLKSYGDKIILIDQANAGPPGARNNGIRAAHGEFISFCDADDIWAPRKVLEQVEYLSDHPHVGMVCSSWREWHPGDEGRFDMPEDFKSTSNSPDIDPANSGWVYHRLLLDCICLTSAVMFRKETIDKVGFFDPCFWNGDDYDYWLRTSRITEIHRLKSRMVLYRILPQSVNRTPTQVNYGFEVLRKSIAQWGITDPNNAQTDSTAVKERLATLCVEFGYNHLKSGDPAIAVKSFWGAIMQKPLWHLPWAYLLMGLWKKLVYPGTRLVAAAY